MKEVQCAYRQESRIQLFNMLADNVLNTLKNCTGENCSNRGAKQQERVHEHINRLGRTLVILGTCTSSVNFIYS